MLDDRQPSVDAAKEIGSQLTSQVDPSKKKQVEAQMADLVLRWYKLSEAAEKRKKQLDGLIGIAKEFHDRIEPLMEWLDQAEKKLVAMETISTEPEKIESQIEDQKVQFFFQTH